MRSARPAVRAAFVAALALSHPAVLRAQAAVSVSGRVSDAASGTPLAAAVVRIVELHREARTHEDGQFTFGVVTPGRYQLTVHRIGYQSVSRELVVRAGLETLVLTMRASPMQLNATVVTGQIAERGAADAVSPVNVLSDARLERRLDATLGSTVAGTPGVSMVTMGPATARPVIRGLGGDRVLILEDGVRTGDLSSTSADHAVAVDPVTARKVEVVRGPMSLLYGSSALGGVVNVIRQEIPTVALDHAHGAMTAQVASVNSGATIGGYREFPLGGLALRAEGSARSAGDLQTPVGRLQNTQVGTLGAALGVSKVGPAGYAGLSYRYFGNEYGIPGGFVGAHPNGVDVVMRRHMLRSEADWHPSGGYFESVKGSVAFSAYNHDEVEKSGSIATSFQQLQTAVELVGRHTHAGPATGGVVGLRGQYRDIRPGGAIRATETADWSLAAFVVEEFGSGPLTWQAGLRYDVAQFTPLRDRNIVVQDDTIAVRPRWFASLSGAVGGLYTLKNGLRLGASLSRSFRTPDFNELYSDGPHLAAYSYDVGDPRNGQETGYGLDVFARLERERVRAELAVFANQMDGYLFPRNTGELGRVGQRWKFQYTNEDATLVGAEGELELTLVEHVVLEATASYVRGTISGSRDTIPGLNGEPDVVESRYLPLMPPLNGRIGVRHETPRWSYGGGVKLAARQTLLGDFETETPGYATADVHVAWRLLVGQRLHSITLRAENLFDAEIREHLSRTKEIIPEAGRNFVLLYRVTF